MFDNPGLKIQSLAKAIFWIQVVIYTVSALCRFIGGIVDIDSNGWMILLAPVSAIVGYVLAWVGVIVLYGFGKLVDDTSAIRDKYSSEDKCSGKEFDDEYGYENSKEQVTYVNQKFICSKCKSVVSIEDNVCASCGQKLNWVKKPKENEYRYCPKCGAETTKDRKFCHVCSEPITENK